MTTRGRTGRVPIDQALEGFRAGRMSAEAAANAAGVVLFEILDRIREAQIPYRLDDEVLAAIDEARTDDQEPGAASST